MFAYYEEYKGAYKSPVKPAFKTDILEWNQWIRMEQSKYEQIFYAEFNTEKLTVTLTCQFWL